ncbi:MAG: hypothetical protein RL885_21480 [Planctomycetota bacterium]
METHWIRLAWAAALVALGASGSVFGQTPSAGPPVPGSGQKLTYRLDIIPTFGGTTSNVSDINERGQVVGTADDTSGINQGFLWEAGIMTPLGVLPGWDHTVPREITERGEVVGAARLRTGQQLAVLWVDGAFTPLGTLGGDWSGAMAANATRIVGWSYLIPANMRVFQAFVFDVRGLTVLGSLPGGGFTSPVDISLDHRTIGSGMNRFDDSRAWIHTDRDGFFELPSLGGLGLMVDPYAINERGDIVGSSEIDATYRDPQGQRVFQSRATLWRDGRLIDLGVFGGFVNSFARDINDGGEIVGLCQTRQYQARPFLWREDLGMVDLNDLVNLPPGDSLLVAQKINDAGQIIGTLETNGQFRGFVLTPVQ